MDLNNVFEKLSENLNFLMTKNRITATKVASQTGIPVSTIKKIRSQANTNPTLATLIPLAQFFSISLEEMINGDFAASSPIINQYIIHKSYQLPVIN